MLRIAQNEDFDAAYSLLRQSFPPDEYRPYPAQKTLLADPRYTLYVTKDLTAVITAWQFEEFSFIEHFAVDPSLRNQGLGTQLLREALALLPSPVCLEAELPETEFAKRRLAFYRRNGFTVNSYPYTQPPYGDDRNPVPMQLLTTGGSITQTEFESIRNTLYREVYNIDKEQA